MPRFDDGPVPFLGGGFAPRDRAWAAIATLVGVVALWQAGASAGVIPTLFLPAPVSIARAFSISVRALHALFEDTDASVAALVRNERLARCLEDLRRRNGGSVTDIAFRWGFCDAAHFSRVFKREFGETPSDVRHEALASSAH